MSSAQGGWGGGGGACKLLKTERERTHICLHISVTFSKLLVITNKSCCDSVLSEHYTENRQDCAAIKT